MADASKLTERLGTIQRAIIKHLFSLPAGKGCSIVKYCDDRNVPEGTTARSRYYKAALLLRKRGLLVTTTKGRKAILTLSGKGSAAAYSIVEEEGQTVIPTVKAMPRVTPTHLPSKRAVKQAVLRYKSSKKTAA